MVKLVVVGREPVDQGQSMSSQAGPEEAEEARSRVAKSQADEVLCMVLAYPPYIPRFQYLLQSHHQFQFGPIPAVISGSYPSQT